MALMDDIKTVLQEVVVPDLKDVKSDLHAFRGEMRVEIKRLDEKINAGMARHDDKIESFRNEMRTEIKRVDQRIQSLDDKLDVAMQIRERLAALESKVATLGH